MKNLFCEQRNLEMSLPILRKVIRSYDIINTYSNTIAKLKYNELLVSHLHNLYSKGYISFSDYMLSLDDVWQRVISYTASALSKK